jgi:Tfp pilus assembly protein FimT
LSPEELVELVMILAVFAILACACIPSEATPADADQVGMR